MKRISVVFILALLLGGCDQTPPPKGEDPPQLHEHEFSTEWSSDENNHWHECECGEISDLAAHTYGAWNHDEENHWKECLICGAKGLIGVHSWDEGVVLPGDEPTLNAAGKMTYTCVVCGHIKTTTIPPLETDHPKVMTIAAILNLENKITQDKDGNGILEEVVAFKATYLASYVDGTKSDRVALLSDGLDYIYVRVALNSIDSYSFNQSYLITGKLSYFYYHLEMTIDSLWSPLSETISCDLKALATIYTIKELNQIANNLTTRDKGAIFSEIVTFEAQYLAKTDNSKALFYDGIEVISGHADNKINNQLTIGNYYQITGLIGKYTGMPSVEILAHEFKSSGEINEASFVTAAQSVNLTNIYQNRPDSWESPYFPYILKAAVYVDVDARSQAGKINKTNDYQIADNYLLKDKINGRISWQSNSLPAEAVIVRNSDAF
ncbi:MAG: hypothetical protein LBR37_03580, partial [Erysipelotrichaceae bacterium]|nr:hypothetical protein [Erysipelotrichaceae bacterium]